MAIEGVAESILDLLAARDQVDVVVVPRTPVVIKSFVGPVQCVPILGVPLDGQPSATTSTTICRHYTSSISASRFGRLTPIGEAGLFVAPL